MIRWLASYPKSGNTWVRLFHCAYEDPDNFDMNRRPPWHRQDIASYVYKYVSPVEIDELSEAEMYALRPATLVWFCRVADNFGHPMYLKTHCANALADKMPIIPKTFTESALVIVRDPRDVAVSFADHLGKTVDEALDLMDDDSAILHKETKIIQPLMSWSSNVESWLLETPYSKFVLRYEDLLSDPEKWFEEILKFYELDFDKGRFKSALDMTTFSALKKREDEVGYGTKSEHQERFFRVGKSGYWKDTLTDEQVMRIETKHGEIMKKVGYLEGVRNAS